MAAAAVYTYAREPIIIHSSRTSFCIHIHFGVILVTKSKMRNFFVLLLITVPASLAADVVLHGPNGTTFTQPKGAPGNVTWSTGGDPIETGQQAGAWLPYYSCTWSQGSADRRKECAQKVGHPRVDCFKVPALEGGHWAAPGATKQLTYCACGPVRYSSNM